MAMTEYDINRFLQEVGRMPTEQEMADNVTPQQAINRSGEQDYLNYLQDLRSGEQSYADAMAGRSAEDDYLRAVQGREAEEAFTQQQRSAARDKSVKDILSSVTPFAKEYIKAQTMTTPELREQLDRNVGLYETPYNIYKELSSISPEDLQLNLQRYSAVDMPEAQLIDTPNLGTSSFQDVQMDPRLMAAAERGLENFRKLSETGMTPEMAAATGKIQRGAMADYMSNVAGTEQKLAQRGMGSSGASAAMALAANQAMANKQAEQQEAMLAEAYKNKLAAMSQDVAGTQKLLATKSESDLARATGLDRLAMTQGSLRADAATRNAAAINAAKLKQAENLQRIGEQNVDIANKQQLHNVVGARQTAADIRKSAAAGMGATAPDVAKAGGSRAAAQSASSAPLQGMVNQAIGNIAQQGLEQLMPSGADFLKNIIGLG